MASISHLKNIFRHAFKIFWVTEYLLIFRDKIDPGIFFYYIPCFCDHKVRFLKNLTRHIAIFCFLSNDEEWPQTANENQRRPDPEIAKFAEKDSA